MDSARDEGFNDTDWFFEVDGTCDIDGREEGVLDSLVDNDGKKDGTCDKDEDDEGLDETEGGIEALFDKEGIMLSWLDGRLVGEIRFEAEG
mmetsp:Transcript_28885/g.35128  ORF Transcript_28885/g.35128 Transcript_28885/m.35128 type:complete len:91 (+) Transcript_28885:197-469(+)